MESTCARDSEQIMINIESRSQWSSTMLLDLNIRGETFPTDFSAEIIVLLDQVRGTVWYWSVRLFESANRYSLNAKYYI